MLKDIVKSARFAPLSCNTQPWRFIIVVDDEKVKRIKNDVLGGIVANKWAHSAPAFIIACAKKSFFVHRIGAGIKTIPYHYLDMGAAIEHILLKATEKGLGTCWIGWFNERALKRLFHIPKTIEVVSLIAVGYKSENYRQPKKMRMEIKDFIFINQYNKTIE